jgi:hypothetical protein
MIKAIEKLKSEMAKNADNTYIQVVGGFLLQHLESNPQEAEKILATDKTIAKSLNEMQKEASKKKVGNCAVLTDQEGFVIVLKYFGMKAAAPKTSPAASIKESQEKKEQAPKPQPNSLDDFDIKLEDLLS